MKTNITFTLIGILSILTISCKKDSTNPENTIDLNPTETFAESDAPENFTHENLNFTGPWGYNKSANSTRNYPIVVVGKWGEGANYYKNVEQDYPAFVIDYQKTSSGDGQALGQWIQSAVSEGYRIDPNRIYLTGFSWGGSSSYPLAQGLHQEGMYFAAIIRVAGQSQSDLGNDIATKTAVWYHIGLNDEPVRVQVARDAMDNMRNYDCNKTAIETSVSDNITGYDRTTITLSRQEREMFKYSEYTGMGHSAGACYKDEALLPWMFKHSLLLN